MFLNQLETFRSHFIQALSRPIQNRCAELAVLLDRATIADLHSIFPLLIDEIFKPNNGINCWPLRNVSNHIRNHQDFQALQHFLSTSGPIFKIIYNLINDPAIKYPFSVNYLPTKVYNNVVGPNRHPFYADLIKVDPHSNQVLYLMLNPFDYYMFHFAYHLINPYCQPTGEVWNTVYYTLCCDYIIHFLPIGSGTPVLPLLEFYNGKNPSYSLPSFNQTLNTSRLLRTDVLNLNKTPIAEYHPRNKIWRSETIVTVFVDFWLSNDQVLMAEHSFQQDYTLAMHKQKIKINEIPTGEYIRIVRVLVKQLHEFANSAKTDETAMSELKKIVIPYLQGKMYIFLRHLIHHWPLDSSFRLVLELWLSFIQPWRYPGDANKKPQTLDDNAADSDDTNFPQGKEIDVCYIRFMVENLFCYTVLFQQLIPRFNRVDLSSPKMALILYRLTKVFSQPNIVNFLREIESCVGSVSNSAGNIYNNQASLPILSQTSSWSTNSPNSSTIPGNNLNCDVNLNNSPFYNKMGSSGKLAEVIKQKMLEYEGPNFVYKPLFYAPTAIELYDLLRYIKTSIMMAESNLEHKIQDDKSMSTGILGFFRTVFGMTDLSIGEFTIEERRKVTIYLEHSYLNLTEMFNVDESNLGITQISKQTETSATVIQDDIYSYLNSYLSPSNVKHRLLNSKYEGNPDLMPVRSDEIGILVRLSYELADKINQRCSTKFNELYSEESFSGRFARQLLLPPQKIFKYDKANVDSCPPRRIQEYLPARVSFRYCASYKCLAYFIIFMILSKLFGYGYFGVPILGFILWSSYILYKAIRDSNYEDCHAVALDLSVFNSSNDSTTE